MNRSLLRHIVVATVIAGTALTFSTGPASAQEIPRGEYLRYFPLQVARITGQTMASEALHLYGDPSSASYQDSDPHDGIDDRRLQTLEALGLRFAPFLAQSSELVPMDFRRFRQDNGLPLIIDTWETAMSVRLVGEETIDWLNEDEPACPSVPNQSADCRLLDLLDVYHPDFPSGAIDRSRASEPLSDPFELLWVSLPGESPETWKDYYEDHEGRLREDIRDHVKTFVHPFLENVSEEGDEPRYQLIFQYWFFYPYNDGGNNHEGDWEHINIVASPRGRVTDAGLTASDMGRVLSGQLINATGDDELVLKEVQYFFHNKVIVLDYSSPNVYAPHDEWRRQADEISRELNSGDFWARHIRFMAYRDDAESQINTHPVGYIGADNKGLDQLLSPPGGSNRDSHGTYPVPGMYKNIGPAGASEAIRTSFDHRDFFSSTTQEQQHTLTRFKRGGTVFLGEPGSVEIVPDYEPVIDLVMNDVDVRRRWAWFILPVRWGYPATRSPLAGIVSHAETGNLSILGPAFNSGWNRSGQNQQYSAYDPFVLPRFFPTSLQDAFSNDLGFLNATGPTLSFLPPFDVLWRVVAAPIRSVVSPPGRVFYPAESLPYRFVSARVGVTSHVVPEAYSDLILTEPQGGELLDRLVEHVQAAGVPAEGGTLTKFVDYQTSAIYAVDLYLGWNVSTTNTLRHARSRIGAALTFSNIPTFEIESELNMWEYAGSFRYSFLSEAVQPFARVGYGHSWYRVEDVSTNGELLPTPQSGWVRQPSLFNNLLPNTWHTGAGLEIVPVRRYGDLPGGIDVGVSVEWNYFINRLGLDKLGVDIQDLILLGADPNELPRERWVGRHAFSATVALSF